MLSAPYGIIYSGAYFLSKMSMEKLSFTTGGQWNLETQPLRKSDDSKMHNVPTGTHEVAVHPDMDNLYRIKGAIQESGKPHIKKGELKKQGFDDNFLKRTPDNGQGLVTSDMIDKHIAGLPKHKVNVNVDDYAWKHQQHRDGPQKIFSVGLHKDTLDKMKNEDPKAHEAWEAIKGDQHFAGDPGKENQLGWGRVDMHSKPGHWHIDEIQSDFQNKDKLQNKADNISGDIPQPIRDYAEGFGEHIQKQIDKHPDAEKLNEKLKPYDHSYDSIMRAGGDGKASGAKYEDWAKHHKDMVSNLEKEGVKVDDKWKDPMSEKDWDKSMEGHKQLSENATKVLPHLSGNHEDPQHLIHSAINELARKHDAKSTSMDMPVDQIIQSGLNNPHTKSALGKIGGPKALQDAVISSLDTTPDAQREGLDELLNQHKDKLTPAEHKTIKSMGEHLLTQLPNSGDLYSKHSAPDKEGGEFNQDAHAKEVAMYHNAIGNNLNYIASQDDSVPVHQRDTYDKRPKKLGMKPTKKKEVMGEHPSEDDDDEVQYSKVYKSLFAMIEAARIHKDPERLAKALNWIDKLKK